MAKPSSVFPPGIAFEELQRAYTANGTLPFQLREFGADILTPDGKQTYFTRHKQFDNIAELWRWCTDNPVKALHMAACRPLGGSDFARREMVFDYDLTDSKERCGCTCAEHRKACPLCWLYARAAMYSMSVMLDVDFGVPVAQVDWYFSGNRGFHCYVLAQQIGTVQVRTATNDQRRALVAQFNYRGNAQRLTIGQKTALPALRAFYAQAIYPAHALHLGEARAPEALSDRQVLELCWPKLDGNVSSDVNHLLRAPLTINPKSGHYMQRVPTHTESIELLNYVPEALARLDVAAAHQ